MYQSLFILLFIGERELLLFMAVESFRVSIFLLFRLGDVFFQSNFLPDDKFFALQLQDRIREREREEREERHSF